MTGHNVARPIAAGLGAPGLSAAGPGMAGRERMAGR
jgi:hypothetical protein